MFGFFRAFNQAIGQRALGLGQPPHDPSRQARVELTTRELRDGYTTAYCLPGDVVAQDIDIDSSDGKVFMLHSYVIKAVPRLWEYFTLSYDAHNQVVRSSLHSEALRYLIPQLYGPQPELETPWTSPHLWSILWYSDIFQFGMKMDQYARELSELLSDGRRSTCVTLALHSWIFFHTLCTTNDQASKIAEERIMAFIGHGHISTATVIMSIEEARKQGLATTIQLMEALHRVGKAERCYHVEHLVQAQDEDSSDTGSIVEIHFDENGEPFESPISSTGSFGDPQRCPSPEAAPEGPGIEIGA